MKAKIMMIIMAAALMALPAMAQQQEWQSTSAMQGSGSAYSAQVTAVGAAEVTEMATTTGSNQSQPAGPNRARRGFDNPGEYGQGDSPIGDAILPLMLMAMLFAGVVYIRRKKVLNR